MVNPRSIRPVQDLVFNRGLFIRYVVLPVTVIGVLWTLSSLSISDGLSDPLHIHLDIFPPPPPPPPPFDPFFDSDHPPPPPPPGPPGPPHHPPGQAKLDEQPRPGAIPPPHFEDEPSHNLPDFPPAPPRSWASAAEEVKAAFIHAYTGYEKYAAPHDELLPITNGYVDNFNGWGVTSHDSLDTMLLMNLTDMFDRAMVDVAKADFDMLEYKRAPFFETAIRHLGGLLSAYALSKNPILLEKADDLGKRLSPVFNTKSGLALFDVNTVNGQTGFRTQGCLAEVGSCQLEYTYLGKESGNVTHYQNADRTWQALKEVDVSRLGGMLPTYFNLDSGLAVDTRLQVGAMADSGHEYILKQYLLTDKTDKTLLEMYLRLTTHIMTRLMWITPTRNILFPLSTVGLPPSETSNRMFEHLACFLPGLFALGVETLPLDNLHTVGIDFLSLASDLAPSFEASYETLLNYKLSDLHRWAADGMTEACAVLYHDMSTGLAPDSAQMDQHSTRWIDALEAWRLAGKRGSPPGVGPVRPVRPTVIGDQVVRDYFPYNVAYELRPETIESLFLMWRLTHEERWRVHGWNIFRALEDFTRTSSGYASLRHVDQVPVVQKDSMPSYFTAETLKYLYLLFSGDDLLPLHDWVLNTEAHPLPVIRWSEAEKMKFQIKT
ncbi:glycoside hydrolase [Vararia minispora EC-137]|uniref:Glycoside hydrolase n=1 Tax=Vararia minispora EC-137 TaxID=1314806 RepID=A0ACB8QV39_9AGAM|nr:glycoside hydrolase [Vararia minispora EC-137]